MGKKSTIKPATGIAVGFNSGHVVTKRNLKQSIKKKPKSQKKELINDVVREITGFSPYEKRLIELIKIGTSAATKRSLKYAKKKLGTHKRGKAKREEIQKIVIMQRRKAATEKH
ncbi:60S ribosomal protein L36, putative [Plasmodium knowlesi strain H]|uniref:60S ribosomal protein L36 n=3 Tax=Plasmodium knowlesi TaxID=5850 RepID=A0A5K1U583_PLAKH|nr:60S ribosomal protein L36, putative [Plasmodium knowlesi strain H]OTN65250.1 60S ribosomal protein L36 [Plasmodium knowlesi]CAA9988119.1 60S ribosomal protein L36, putative [Plasmodium knowlesi strain H]SBO19998.1 60S ribosomal protein L36, putative [Plasmodium knowlesi strain H]SBO29122.1 60S ribosomal protein L36, putative [Plasmodium knowlesi strain H]VVS77593.1 60S ribosomal protein L36, putative [Plasmodium knowlesi strain H]|eukprot:XP_002259093.1 60s ribosomal protein l36, putative [Plasmodium knowlesi strain H]